MAANNIYLQVTFNSQAAQQNVNALNNAIAQTGTVAQQSSKQASAALGGLNISIQQTVSAFGQITAALAGLGIGRLVTSVIQVGSELGRAQTMMEAFTGSAGEATKVFQEIRAVAAQSPFRMKDLEETGRRLAGFRVQARDIAPTLKIIGDQVAAMGGSIENVNSIVSIFGRVMNKEFIGAMDLMRLLPQQAVSTGKALQDAISKQLGGTTVTIQEVQKYIKEGVLDPAEALRAILGSMEQKTGGAGARIKDFAFYMKTLGDAFDYATKQVLGPEGFAPALAKLGQEIQIALTPLAALFDYIMKLPEPTKELIVNITAGTAAVVAFAGAWTLFTTVAGPAIDIIFGLGKAIVWLVTTVLANPEMLAFTATLAGFVYTFTKMFPEETKNMLGSVETFIGGLVGKLKDTIGKLAKESGLFDFFKVPDLSKATGKILVETEDNLKKVQDMVDAWSASASKTLLGALSSPAEAITIKYAELFKKLNEQVQQLAITPEHAEQMRGTLSTAQAQETAAKELEQRKTEITELEKFHVEKIKGSYDAVIAYDEAMGDEDLRHKVATIDKVTQLRMDSAQAVAEDEKHHIDETLQAQMAVIEAYKDLWKAAGVDVNDMIARLTKEAGAKKDLIDQKAIDESQKYRLEGWKKSNDLIIEDQKRVFDAFKSEFDEVFDAITGKTKNIGQALADVFKKLVLGEAKNIFSSQLAGFATEAAGYGAPSPEITRSGGILSQLFRRGMPPRAPGAAGGAPSIFRPEHSSQQIDYLNVGQGEANRTISDIFNPATMRFAIAVNQFEKATEMHQGSADRMADTADQMADSSDQFSGAFAAASQATGVEQPLLRAVAQVESGMRPGAVSPKGAIGLMQLMPSTMQDWGVTQGADVQQNVMGGASQLGKLLDRYGGDIPAALAAYNMGPTAYDRAIVRGRPLPQETQDYVQRVMGLMGQGATPLEQATHAFQTPPAAGDSGAMADLLQPPQIGAPGMPASTGMLANAAPWLRQLLGAGGMAGGIAGGAQAAGVGGGAGMSRILTTLMKPGGLSALAMLFGAHQAGSFDIAGLPSRNAGMELTNLEYPQTAFAPTSLKSILGSQGAKQLGGALAMMGGMALVSKGLQQRSAPATAIGGGLAGAGAILSNPQLLAKLGPAGIAEGAAAGVGLGIFASGFQRGGGAGLGMDIGGGALAGAAIGTMVLPGLGTAIGAAAGAVAGAITGVVRLFVKTESERIATTIKQVYGINITNRALLTQIQQIVDTKYGGSVSIGVRSQEVQDLVRLYALSTGQAANMPRPMYAATVAQSTQGLQQQAVYQGGQLVQNPYNGPTTYQYQTAVAGAQGLMPGTSLGAVNASGLINQQWTQLTLDAIRSNPAAVANAGAAAASAGDSRLSTTQAMQEPLTALS